MALSHRGNARWSGSPCVQVFVRERLNGYYGAAAYTAANTVAALPFLALIAAACTVVVYYLAGLNSDADRVVYFLLTLFAALTVVRPPHPPPLCLSICAPALPSVGCISLFMCGMSTCSCVTLPAAQPPAWPYSTSESNLVCPAARRTHSRAACPLHSGSFPAPA